MKNKNKSEPPPEKLAIKGNLNDQSREMLKWIQKIQ